MLQTIVLLCLVALGGSKDLQKRQAGYGAPTGEYGAPAGPALEASYNGVGYGVPTGGKCRTTTKYALTWTSTVLPLAVYDTETHQLPTTLYQYVTETVTAPTTEVQLVTTTHQPRPGYREDTRISYRTRTLVVPQVEVITSTLVLTDDEHVTVTETDHLTRTRVQPYPVEVTTTSVVSVPEIITSVSTAYETQYQTQYTTQLVDMVQTRTVSVPEAQYITSTFTQVEYQTVAVTGTQLLYHTVTQCPQQGYHARY